MSERFIRYMRHRVYHLIGYQACSICLMTLMAFLFAGKQTFFSVFMGAMVFFIPNWFYLLFSSNSNGADGMSDVVKKSYVGQAIKLVMVVGLGVLCMNYFKIKSLFFLFAFIFSILVHCFTLLFIFQSR